MTVNHSVLARRRPDLLVERILAGKQQLGRGLADDHVPDALLFLDPLEVAAAQQFDAHRLEVGAAGARDTNERRLGAAGHDSRAS